MLNLWSNLARVRCSSCWRESCGHAIHNQNWNMILKSQKRSDRSVTQWKPVALLKWSWMTP
jgi:hypothetical protein